MKNLIDDRSFHTQVLFWFTNNGTKLSIVFAKLDWKLIFLIRFGFCYTYEHSSTLHWHYLKTWRKSVHYWWSYILFAPECNEFTCMIDPLLYRWGVPPVVIRCVHWTMQRGVLQTWITLQSPVVVMNLNQSMPADTITPGVTWLLACTYWQVYDGQILALGILHLYIMFTEKDDVKWNKKFHIIH